VRLTRGLAALLFASALFILVVHANPPLRTDRFPRLALLIVHQRSLSEPVDDPVRGVHVAKFDDLVIDGRLYCNTNPGQAFLMVPGAVIATRFGPSAERLATLLMLVCGPLPLCALAIVALVEMGLHLGLDLPRSLAAAALFFLGTPFLTLSCMGVQNGPQAALGVIAAWAIFVDRRWSVPLAGGVMGLAFLVDAAALLLAAILGVVIARTRGRRSALIFFAVFVASSLVTLGPYDQACFGSWSALPNRVFFTARVEHGVLNDTIPRPGPAHLDLEGLDYAALSWTTGLLWFTPFVVVALWSTVRGAASSASRNLGPLGAVPTLVALLYDASAASWSHHEVLQNGFFGPRYQLWAAPFAALALVAGGSRQVAWGAGIWSIAVGLCAAMYPPVLSFWRFYASWTLVLLRGPRAPLVSALLGSRASLYEYRHGEASGWELSCLALLLLGAWARYARVLRTRAHHP